MLKFKIDENLPDEAAELLAGAGHDAVTVGRQGMSGRPDADVAATCRQEARVIVTLDLDFADIRAFPPADYPGVVVLRLARLDKRRVLSVMRRLVPLLVQETLVGKLWIVDEMSVRVRG